MDKTCNDCLYYLPVDVFRGLCKMSKKKITPDDPFCDQAALLAKCKFCTNYTAEKDFLGKCMMVTLAYPDMTATKCADFQWCKQD
jgi:hypothetical protein